MGESPRADVVGVGINATDTILRLPRFPSPDSKVELLSADLKAGGQVASAVTACCRWDLAARYVGKIGDDAAGKFQMEEMAREGVEAHWIMARGHASQSAFILVDQQTGERTVLWKRDPWIALRSEDLQRQWIAGARLLLVDGHDTEAATTAARWAHEEKIPVLADLDNLYPGVEALLELVDYPVMSKDFPERLTGEPDLLKSLPRICREYRCRTVAATLGRMGVLAWDRTRFLACPGFHVQVMDTTGAGDIFHGAFAYGLVRSWPMDEILEFSSAAAALNCTALGARGGIATLNEISHLREHGERSEPPYSESALRDAAREAAPMTGAGR